MLWECFRDAFTRYLEEMASKGDIREQPATICSIQLQVYDASLLFGASEKKLAIQSWSSIPYICGDHP